MFFKVTTRSRLNQINQFHENYSISDLLGLKPEKAYPEIRIIEFI